MKSNAFISLIALLFVSCGKNGFFSEAYWSDPSSLREDKEAFIVGNYTVDLAPISDDLINVTGRVALSVNETDFNTRITVDEFPQSLMLGQGSITNQTCGDITASNSTPSIINDTGEFKKVDLTESGSREALVAQLNLDNPQNGDSVNLRGKSFVLKAYVKNSNLPGSESLLLIPVACGVITFVN